MEPEKKSRTKTKIPDQTFSVEELASSLHVLAKEYKTTLPALLRKLDRVSGNVNDLAKVYAGDYKC